MTALFENASENNDLLHVSNMNDEARNNIPDEVSELSVPGSLFDWQSHTHHSWLFPVFFEYLLRAFAWFSNLPAKY